MNKKIAQVFMMLAAVVGMPSAMAADPAGRVLVAVGDVSVLRAGKSIPLMQGATIEAGDMLRTGTTSNAQVRMTDGAIISLRPETEFHIEDYRFVGKDDGSEKGFFKLVKGGFRTISGLIGKTNRDNYKITTSTATIGIRGTDYTLVDCANCLNADGSKAKDGLYGSVSDGKINVANQGGGKDFGRAEAFYVANAQTPPQGLIAPPSFLADKLAARGRAQNREGQKSEGASQAAQSGQAGQSGQSAQGATDSSSQQMAITPDGRSGATAPLVMATPVATTTYVAAETVSAAGTSSVLPATDYFEAQLAYAFPGSSQVMELCGGGSGGCGDLSSSNGTVTAYSQSHAIGTFSGVSGGSLTDTGSTSVDGATVYWGRWAGATVSDPWNSGTPPTGLHYIVTGSGPYGSSDPAVIDAKSGSVTYAFVDGTRAWDSNGNVGSKMSGSLGINFTARTITPNITYAVGGLTYNITGFSMTMPAGQIGISSGSNANGTGSCVGGACSTGHTIDYVVLNTTFVGATGGGVIAGVSTAMASVTNVSTAAVGLFKAP